MNENEMLRAVVPLNSAIGITPDEQVQFTIKNEGKWFTLSCEPEFNHSRRKYFETLPNIYVELRHAKTAARRLIGEDLKWCGVHYS